MLKCGLHLFSFGWDISPRWQSSEQWFPLPMAALGLRQPCLWVIGDACCCFHGLSVFFCDWPELGPGSDGASTSVGLAPCPWSGGVRPGVFIHLGDEDDWLGGCVWQLFLLPSQSLICLGLFRWISNIKQGYLYRCFKGKVEGLLDPGLCRIVMCFFSVPWLKS